MVIKWDEKKAFDSGAKKITSLLEQIGLGGLWVKAHYADIGRTTKIAKNVCGGGYQHLDII